MWWPGCNFKQQHSSDLVFREMKHKPGLFTLHYLMVHETLVREKKQHLSCLQQPLSICYWSKSSFHPPLFFFGEDRWTDPAFVLEIRLITGFAFFVFFVFFPEGSVWIYKHTQLSNICPRVLFFRFFFFFSDLNGRRWRRLILFCCEAAW